MLSKRIIPCLDVKNGKVVKGIQFKNHQIMGDIVELAQHYCDTGADELVFYDITASCEQRLVNLDWISAIAKTLSIPFCVAGGIDSVAAAESILNAGADKISINSPALKNPDLIDELANCFGQQCVVVGIDSLFVDGHYKVCQYTGDTAKTLNTQRFTEDWVTEVQQRGAGEIVLNCMNQDGMRLGYDLDQLIQIRAITRVPLVASGGAGAMQDFVAAFAYAKVDAALAASVFHSDAIPIHDLKIFLQQQGIVVRL